MLSGTIVVGAGLVFSGALDRRDPAARPIAQTAVQSAAQPATATEPVAALPPLAGTVANFSLFDPVRPAPAAAFTDGDGHPVRLTDFRGKVVLLNLWATWCVPCVLEMPALDRLQAALGGQTFAVLALSQDRDGIPAVVRFYEKYDFGNLGIYVDSEGGIGRALRAEALPTSIIIDRDGNMVGELVGAAEWDAPEAKALIRHYLEAARLPSTTTAAGG